LRIRHDTPGDFEDNERGAKRAEAIGECQLYPARK